jgi:phospholipase/carboxylesterase
MNRIALATQSVSGHLSGSNGLLDRTNVGNQHTQTQTGEAFATFSPIHYERGYAYPLLVWLHSTGGNERELRRVMPLVSMRNFVAVAPRGSTDELPRGNCWRQTRDDIESAEASVAHCLAAAKRRFNIHARRIFLAGCGSGGTMALRIAWNDPARIAGVVTINGPLPTGWRPLGRVNELRRVPCLLATSRDSRAYPATQVCRDLKLLHSAGCTVALRQYPGSHDLTSKMLSDMNLWLMELVCSGGAS